MPPLGWCPSTHRLYSAPDGALARIKVPGGVLRTEQLRAVAEAAALGGGRVELTSRANLQVRGLDPAVGPALRSLLEPVGLSSPVPEVEDRRNVLAAPTAGLDPEELLDVRPLVSGVVDALDALGSCPVPHKFGVVLDGGGRPSLVDRTLDVVVGAVGAEVVEVGLGRALPPYGPPGVVVAAERVPEVVAAAARVCAGEGSGPRRGRMAVLVARHGPDVVRRALGPAVPIDAPAPASIPPGRRDLVAPLGHVPGPDGGYLGARPRGEPRGAHLRALAAALDAHGLDEVRLTPWRTVVVPLRGVHPVAVAAALAAAGWGTGPRDPAVVGGGVR